MNVYKIRVDRELVDRTLYIVPAEPPIVVHLRYAGGEMIAEQRIATRVTKPEAKMIERLIREGERKWLTTESI